MKKVLVAALLLLCVCRLQAAHVRREAPVEETTDQLTRHFQTFSDFMTKDLPQKLKIEELQSEAKDFVSRAKQHLSPAVEELRSSFLNFYTSVLEMIKAEGQP